MLRYYLLIPFFTREVYLHTPAIYLTSEYQNRIYTSEEIKWAILFLQGFNRLGQNCTPFNLSIADLYNLKSP